MASNAIDAELFDEEGGTVSVTRLRRELAAPADASSTDQHSEEVLASVLDALFPDEEFAFEEALVKHSLDELLVVLVALRNGGTHGKGLMEDLSTLFDADLSPGTVYPRLHELEEDDRLEMHELVRTKEYHLDDHGGARADVEAAMRQHLALGLFFHAALEEL